MLGVGRSLLRALRFSPNNAWEEAALSFGLGYGTAGTLLLLLGLGGLWQSKFLLGFLGILTLASIPGLKDLALSIRGTIARGDESRSRPDAVTSCGAALVLLLGFCELRYALIPETFYDALVYHLALPAQYVLHGRIYPTPSNSFSGVPGLPQMLSGVALSVSQWGIVAAILHWSLMLWCCAALVGLSRRLGRPRSGVLAAVIFAATPVVVGEAFRVSVGLEWTLMELCCLTGVLALAEDADSPIAPGSFLTGCFLGFVMATKYPAWLVSLAVVPVLAAGRLGDASQRLRVLKSTAIIASVSALFISPWVLKNLAFYGNPLYPFFHEHFAAPGAVQPDWRQISAAGTDLHQLFTPSGIWGFATHLWTFLRPSEDVTESMGPVYLALLPALLMFPSDRRGKLVALFALVAWIPLSLLTPQPRYFIPHLAVLSLLTAHLIEGLTPSWNAATFRTGAVGLSSLMALGWLVMDANRAKLPVYLGSKSFNDYLAHTTVSYPGPAYAAYQFLNEQIPGAGKVLIYGEARNFYLKRDSIISTADQKSALEAWADESPDAPSLARKIRTEGAAHILVNPAELIRQHQPPRVTPAGLHVLDDFWKHYTLRVFGVFDPHDRWVGVYKLLDDSEAARPHPVDDLFGPYLKKQP